MDTSDCFTCSSFLCFTIRYLSNALFFHIGLLVSKDFFKSVILSTDRMYFVHLEIPLASIIQLPLFPRITFSRSPNFVVNVTPVRTQTSPQNYVLICPAMFRYGLFLPEMLKAGSHFVIIYIKSNLSDYDHENLTACIYLVLLQNVMQYLFQ